MVYAMDPNNSVIEVVVYIFLISQVNVCCRYSSADPLQGTSNEYPQHICFLWEIRKISTFGQVNLGWTSGF